MSSSCLLQSTALTGQILPRSTGPIEALRHIIPPVLYPVFIVITYFGSVSTLLVGLSVLYWLDGRERIAFVMSIALGGAALTVALKAIFALPRPPDALHLIAIQGYGFPSGHAIMATVVYGSSAIVLVEFRRVWRILGAGVAVTLIALSRVVLGVHYPADVIAGIIIGLIYLGGVLIVANRNPQQSFWIATVVAGAAVVITHITLDSVNALGSTLGAALVWNVTDTPALVQSRSSRMLLVAVGLPIVGVLGYLSLLIPPSLGIAFTLSGLLSVTVLGLPTLVPYFAVGGDKRTVGDVK